MAPNVLKLYVRSCFVYYLRQFAHCFQRKRVELYNKTRDTNYFITFYFSVEGVGADEEIIDILRSGVDLGDIRTVMETKNIRECLNGGRHMPCVVIIDGEIGQVRLAVSLSAYFPIFSAKYYCV